MTFYSTILLIVLFGMYYLGHWIKKIPSIFFGLLLIIVSIPTLFNLELFSITWLNLLTSAAIGFILFFLSITLTTKKPIQEISNLFSYLPEIKLSDLKKHITTHLLTAIYEEWIWRVIVLVILIKFTNIYLAIFIESFLFWSIHISNFKNRPSRATEFIIFTFIISCIFAFQQNYSAVTIIHFIRNILIIIYRSSILKLEETK